MNEFLEAKKVVSSVENWWTRIYRVKYEMTERYGEVCAKTVNFGLRDMSAWPALFLKSSGCKYVDR